MLKSVKNTLSQFRFKSYKEVISHTQVTQTKTVPPEASTKQPQSTFQYCVNLVKQHDYEGFLATSLIPDPKARRALFAIRAFNVEVAIIRENVTFKETGLGRLAFWRDAVEHLYGKYPSKSLPRHPVIEELAREVVVAGALSKRWFTNLVECRQDAMSDAPFPSVDDLEAYCEKSVTPIFYITFDFLGLKTKHLDHAASHFGKTIGITNFIRSLPHASKQRRVLVPQDLLLKYKLSQENFIRLDEPEKIQDVVYDLASQAVAHYEHAKTLRGLISLELLKLGVHGSRPDSVFMAVLPSKFYLERLEKRGFNPYDPSLTRRYGLLPWRLYYNKLRKRYIT